MTTVSKNAAPVKTHRSKAKAEATRRGLLYALPDWLMIIMLFFVPIVLLVIMAGSRWSLMGGNRGWNFPENFVKVFENKLLGQSVLFTLEYTVIVTIFLLVLGLGLALIVQESTKWNKYAAHVLPAAVRNRSRLRFAAVLRAVLPAGGPRHQDPELLRIDG